MAFLPLRGDIRAERAQSHNFVKGSPMVGDAGVFVALFIFPGAYLSNEEQLKYFWTRIRLRQGYAATSCTDLFSFAREIKDLIYPAPQFA